MSPPTFPRLRAAGPIRPITKKEKNQPQTGASCR